MTATGEPSGSSPAVGRDLEAARPASASAPATRVVKKQVVKKKVAKKAVAKQKVTKQKVTKQKAAVATPGAPAASTPADARPASGGGAPEPWRPWSPPPAAGVVTGAVGAPTGRASIGPDSVADDPSISVPIGERGFTDWVGRLLVQPDAQGPRMRVGVVWFLLLVPAAWFGVGWTAALFSLVAAIAALQVRMTWSRRGYWASRAVAASTAFALPWLGVVNEGAAGALLVVVPVVALVRSAMVGPPRRRVSVVGTAGVTLRCAVPPGLAALGMVLTGHTGATSAVLLVVLISAYDLGCFLFGAESAPVTGIVGGVICTMAVAAPVWAFQLPPFDGRSEGFVYAGLVAVTAPLGQLMASLALPTAAAWAPALRRLDSYIVTAPLWAWSLSRYLS